MYDGGWHDHGTGWWWIGMVLMMAAFWGGLAWIAVTLVRHGVGRGPAQVEHGETPRREPTPGGPAGGAPDPRQILAARLARGEIEIDDYRSRMAALAESPR